MVQASSAPYGGTLMKQAKDAIEVLEGRIQKKIHEERDATIAEAKQKMQLIQQQEAYSKIGAAEQDSLLKPFNDVISKAKTRYNADLILDGRVLLHCMRKEDEMLIDLMTEHQSGLLCVYCKPETIQFQNLLESAHSVLLLKGRIRSSLFTDSFSVQLAASID